MRETGEIAQNDLKELAKWRKVFRERRGWKARHSFTRV